MRFIVKQKIFSLSDSFIINDENNNPAYKVMGRLFALGDQLNIYSVKNNEQIYIQQKIFKLLPEYHLFKDGSCVAIIKKEFTFFKPNFNISSERGSYKVSGDFLGYNFNVLKENRKVASVSKAFFSFRDTYAVDICPSEDQIFLLAVCIVIDQTLHDRNHNNN